MKTIDKLPRTMLIYLARQLSHKAFTEGRLLGIPEELTNKELADFISRSI